MQTSQLSNGVEGAAIEGIESRALRKLRLRLIEAAADQDLAEEMRGVLSRSAAFA